MGPLMAAAHPDAFTLIDRSASVAAARVRPAPQSPQRRPGAHHPRLRRASGAHRIDGVGKPLALALHPFLTGDLTLAAVDAERAVDDLDLTVALVVADHDAGGRNARAGQLERMRRRAVREQLLAAAENDRQRKNAHRVDQIVGEQCMHEFGTALRDKVRAVLALQTLHSGDVAEEHRALPARIDLARERNRVLLDLVEQFRDAAVGRIFVGVRPVPGENLVGPAAEEKIEVLEDAVELFAKLFIEIGQLPAAELEALGRILSWPAGRLHDAIHGNHGADDYLPHGSLSLFEPRTNGPLPIRHVPTLTSWRAVRFGRTALTAKSPD